MPNAERRRFEKLVSRRYGRGEEMPFFPRLGALLKKLAERFFTSGKILP